MKPRPIRRFLCAVFGHRWYYQQTALSDLVGQFPARVCIRCQWRRCERYINDEWVYDPISSIPSFLTSQEPGGHQP